MTTAPLTNVPPAPGDDDGARLPADDGPSRQPPEQRSGSEGSSPTLFERVASLFRPRNEATLQEQLTEVLAESGEDLTVAERGMLSNFLAFRELRVEDVMVPRSDIEALEENATLGEALRAFGSNGRSRMPVYAGSMDDPRGMIHFRDVLGLIARSGMKEAELSLASIDLTRPIGELALVRQVLFVPPSMHAADLLSRMQTERTQMALVIDEYGGTDGLVSLEDIVETLVGNIEDEHDEEENLIVAGPEGGFVVNAKAPIDDLVKAFGDDFAIGSRGDYIETLGGLIFDELGRVPLRGETVAVVPGYEFQILEADPRRVRRVKIRKLRPPQ